MGPARFESAWKLSSYLLFLIGFSALLTSEALSVWPGAAFLVLVLASWRSDRPVDGFWTMIAFCLLFGVFAVDLALFSGLVKASLHLLMLVSLLKLYAQKTPRDYLMIYAISFTFLLIASAYTLSIVFLITLVLYAFSSILTFILFESRTAYLENQGAPFQLTGYLTASALITGLIVVVSAPIFVTIPRTSWGLFKMHDQLDANLSGFTDRVELGDIGRIISNRDIFMRVRVDRPLEEIPADLKWRGVVLNYYDGASWSVTDRDSRSLMTGPNGELVELSRDRRQQENLLRQQVTTEPNSNVIFAASKVIHVAPLQTRGASVILRDQNGALRLISRGAPRYTAYSDLVPRGEQLSRTRVPTLPPRMRRRFLQLPQLDPRVSQLMASVVQGHAEPIAQALVLENFLKNEFRYSLDNLSASAEDPLADFLFNTRSGHCEFFATAMAVMLRTHGIPSRIVNGFRRGEYNEWSDYFIVRQSDAHSWIEAYLPGAGWVEFDPTPATTDSSFYLARMASRLLDAVDLFWTELISFDRGKQFGFFQGLRDQLRDGAARIAGGLYNLDSVGLRWLEKLRQPGLIQWLTLGLLLAGPLLVWTLYRARHRIGRLWRRISGRSRQQDAPEYFLELIDILSRKGFARQKSETAQEFAFRIAASFESRVPLDVTACYYRARFGSQAPSSTELHQIRRDLEEFRKLQQRDRGAPSPA